MPLYRLKKNYHIKNERIGERVLHKMLKYKKVVLASGSPRRVEIFSMLKIPFVKATPNINETLFDACCAPSKFVKNLSTQKALSVAQTMSNNCFVVAADTICYAKGSIITKPKDRADAARMLNLFSGTRHSVYTGVCISYHSLQKSAFAKTNVHFKKLSKRQIAHYIQTGEYKDKAGGYAIQGLASQFVEKICGCPFNIIGFPISLFYSMSREILFC